MTRAERKKIELDIEITQQKLNELIIKLLKSKIEDEPKAKTKLYKIMIPNFEAVTIAESETDALNFAIGDGIIGDEINSIISKLNVNNVREVKSWNDINDPRLTPNIIPWGDESLRTLEEYLGTRY